MTGVVTAVTLVLALLLGAGATQAQTVSKLVGNTGQASTASLVSFENDSAQAFTTGSHPSGYTLTQVKLRGRDTNTSGSVTYTVSVHEDSSNAPGTLLATLTNPASLPSTEGEVQFTTLTTDGIALAADTTYWLVVDIGATIDPYNRVSTYFNMTASDDEDTDATTDGSIDDGLRFRDHDAAAWNTSPNSLKLAVHGYARSLVSNTGQSDDTDATFNNDLAQAFTTGSHTHGYTLKRVDMELFSDSAAPTYTVKIHSDSSSAPGAEQGTLTNPTGSLPTSAELVHFTSSDGIRLDASTTYWVVVDVSNNPRDNTGDDGTQAKKTTSNAEDGGGATGWSIANNRLWRLNNTTTWNTPATNDFIQIAIHGVANDPPADTTAPTFQSARLSIQSSGVSRLSVIFNEDLDASSLPTGTVFTLREQNGTTHTGTMQAPMVLIDATVSTFLDSPPAYGAPVTLSYTPPGTNPLQDAAGNPVAAFSGKSVTVNDGRSPPGGGGNNPGGSGNNPGGGGNNPGGGGNNRDDHGNSASRATRIPPRGYIGGQLHTPRDVDYFTFTAPHAGVLVVETIGAADTRGAMQQDRVVLARADSGGSRRNFRLQTRVEAGEVVIAVAGNGQQTRSYVLQTTLVRGYLGNPGDHSFQSGIGVLSGWVCEAEGVRIEINGVAQPAAYGTERRDTEETPEGEELCGDTDNGFGLLFNWNLLEDGEHEVVALVDGVKIGRRSTVDGIELGRATVTVTTLGEEFRRGLTGSFLVEDFPRAGEQMSLVWQESRQNFGLAPAELGATHAPMPAAGGIEGELENPAPASYQSGLGVISGWVCEADAVEIVFETAQGGVHRLEAAYGTERADTATLPDGTALCGDTANGFGLLFNWNLLGDGAHEVVALVDGVELSRTTVTVTRVDETEPFVRGLAKRAELVGFPTPEETVTVEWQQGVQNFVITGVE